MCMHAYAGLQAHYRGRHDPLRQRERSQYDTDDSCFMMPQYLQWHLSDTPFSLQWAFNVVRLFITGG
jgi:hypothetical protein